MTQTYLAGLASSVHRIDVACEQSGFTVPPHEVHIKMLPPSVPGEAWTFLGHAAAGKPDALARWLRTRTDVEQIRVAGGIAPKVLRAKFAVVPPVWGHVAEFARIHHLGLTPDGNATWFVEGTRERVTLLVQHFEQANALPATMGGVRCRPVPTATTEPGLSRRQFEALASAVALGYYEIPHRIDLRTLGKRTGISLGSISELLRRAEATVLTRYVDGKLMPWPDVLVEEPPAPLQLGLYDAIARQR